VTIDMLAFKLGSIWTVAMFHPISGTKVYPGDPYVVTSINPLTCTVELIRRGSTRWFKPVRLHVSLLTDLPAGPKRKRCLRELDRARQRLDGWLVVPAGRYGGVEEFQVGHVDVKRGWM